MSKEAFLILEDGTVYTGEPFGFEGFTYGEVVFNTSMTGYQEMLTDPSYSGQIVVPTYPLIGNYGIHRDDVESGSIQVSGFVVRQHCVTPSHTGNEYTLDEYLTFQKIPAVSGLDTRSLTRRLRTRGVMMGLLTSVETPSEGLKRLRSLPRYGETDLVPIVSTSITYPWDQGELQGENHYRIVVLDLGLKYNILRILRNKGCEVFACPASTSAEDIFALNPHGIVFSPGPGDPAVATYAVDTARKVLGRIPILGICLGHQVLARAVGAETYKLKFGHRGANHPVQDLGTGRVYITAQNHGYAVDAESLPSSVEASHINLNDGTVEGLRHRELSALSIQYHSEASPGPRDNEYLFDQFLDMVKEVSA